MKLDLVVVSWRGCHLESIDGIIAKNGALSIHSLSEILALLGYTCILTGDCG